MPSERRFVGGPIVTRDWILAGHIICRGRPLSSFAVSRAANSIDPDQAEPIHCLQKIFLAEDKTDMFYCVKRFSTYFQNVMLFSEKCADPDEKSYYACGN